jgi:hypothetical protein
VRHVAFRYGDNHAEQWRVVAVCTKLAQTEVLHDHWLGFPGNIVFHEGDTSVNTGATEDTCIELARRFAGERRTQEHAS